MKADNFPESKCGESTTMQDSHLPAWIDQELICYTIRVWQPYYIDTLTVDIALEMLTNTGCLFDALGHSMGVAS